MLNKNLLKLPQKLYFFLPLYEYFTHIQIYEYISI